MTVLKKKKPTKPKSPTKARQASDPHNWEKRARVTQREPKGRWHVWLIMAGRGFGKTRTGAETIRKWVAQGTAKRIALVGQTMKEVESVMVRGESGLMGVHPMDERPRLNNTLNQLEWPNGAIATFYGADAYDKLRGPQFDAAWVDELAKFRYPQEAWDQLMFSLRLGKTPRVIVTTTPRPSKFLEALSKKKTCAVTRGSTLENKKNLSKLFLRHILDLYKNTRLGSQEIYGELLKEVEGALWMREMIRYRTPFCL